jgi:actin-related protein
LQNHQYYQRKILFIKIRFSCGRSTCLVFDSGHHTTYATPVHDGYTLQKSLIKFDIAGSYLTNELLKIVDKRTPVIPHYKFNKTSVDDIFFKTEYLEGIKDDPSYESFWKKEIVRDLKENMMAVAEDPINK